MLADNFTAIHARIAAAVKSANRHTDDIHLIAVSKTQQPEAVQAAIDIGQRSFGENRVQEAQSKFPRLKNAYPDLQLHLIGPLQTNKVKVAIELFDAIHTIDRNRLAAKVADEIQKQNRQLTCFIEVNTGAEPQKAGVPPQDLPDLLHFCQEDAGLKITGLMCIPPADQIPAPHFKLLAELAKEYHLPLLSMGMSADFTTAIQYGATHIRVGAALFGHRVG